MSERALAALRVAQLRARDARPLDYANMTRDEIIEIAKLADAALRELATELQTHVTYLLVEVRTVEADAPGHLEACRQHQETVTDVAQMIEARLPLNPTLGKADWRVLGMIKAPRSAS